MSQPNGAVYTLSRKPCGHLNMVEFAFSNRNTDTDNNIHTACCPAGRSEAAQVVLSDYSHQPLTLCPAEATSSFLSLFFSASSKHWPYFWSFAVQTYRTRWHKTKREQVLYYLTQLSLFIKPYCSGLKSHSLSKTEVKIYVSCQRKEMSRASMQGVCPLCPVIKAIVHPSIPEVALVSSCCLKIITYRASFPLHSVLVWWHILSLYSWPTAERCSTGGKITALVQLHHWLQGLRQLTFPSGSSVFLSAKWTFSVLFTDL